ncbi:MAG: DUF924 family protein [Noviherbaspirillum sp.]
METTETINAFWFGTLADDKAVADERARLWWAKNTAVDADIRRRFESCVTQAAKGELHAWTATPSGRLALILLADQFTRNMYRDTPAAFALDPLARAWCREGLRDGADRALRPIERVFFYLPLEHSESLEEQDRAVSLFEQLASEVRAEHKANFDGFLDFAVRHRDVIRRFGRFPHRNRILDRESSPEERAFLLQKGSSF